MFRGGLILYINENVPCRPLTDHPVFSDLELMLFELRQSKRKGYFQEFSNYLLKMILIF